ncbi:MAG: hypothetical protein B7Z37_16385 [Verrucomicrobia bacterium 12-59-8]|nr:MAG: hypothetical protein B7Z37_16385 [Verrucomicrobia bacterium 12-59-8]
MLKTLIKQTLRLFGVRLIRFREEPEVGDVLTIGAFKLVTDNEELIRSYRDYPLTNSVIARIVSMLARENEAFSMIDVGANCGDSASIAKTAHDLPILCIEPDEHIFGILERNAVQFTKVDILRQYLGESAGSSGFAVTKTGWNNTLVTAADETAAILENLISFDSSNVIPKALTCACCTERGRSCQSYGRLCCWNTIVRGWPRAGRMAFAYSTSWGLSAIDQYFSMTPSGVSLLLRI